jgi:tRNA-specific 2-thiouridylase
MHTSNTPNSLGFDKPPSETRVVVAMSGGVDSSVAAALLHEQGYEVIGITLQLYDYGDAIAKKGACCAGKDIYDAKRVAEERGFPHYVLNYESNFKESVIENFVDSYLKGETPIPCVTCNQTVKFKDLLKVARDLNADCMVTGHYVQRIVNSDGIAELHRAEDLSKDQSYFLFATTQDQLDFLRFPLGGWSKDITRQHAERLGLVNASKPDSQDICFVPNGDYASVVTKIVPEAKRSGQIVHLDGRIVGTHDGIVHFTIGQRKGLGIGGGVTENNEPLYVVGIDAETAKVIVGPKKSLARDKVFLKNFNWLIQIPKEPIKIDVKLRSMTRALPATLMPQDDGSAEITLDDPQYGVSPGQAAVCYIGGHVIGGGWITRTALSDLSKALAA